MVDLKHFANEIVALKWWPKIHVLCNFWHNGVRGLNAWAGYGHIYGHTNRHVI